MGQQQGAQLGPPLLGRFVEGSERPFVCGIDACVVLNQQGGDVHVLHTGEQVEVKKRTEKKQQGRRRRKEEVERRRNSNENTSAEQMCDVWCASDQSETREQKTCELLIPSCFPAGPSSLFLSGTFP